jgi:fluoroquinolone resistance protein
MSEVYISDETFTAAKLPKDFPMKAIYDACVFEHLDLSGVDLSGFQFIDCLFSSTNLAGVKLAGTGIRNTRFVDCKMTGIHFDDCHPLFFDPLFERCILDLSSFYRRTLADSSLAGCSLKEVDFTEADLSRVDFSGADLMDAIFDGTQLLKADFRDAKHIRIDPEKNLLKKAFFRYDALAGLLGKYELFIE